jgi:hypothetical protein
MIEGVYDFQPADSRIGPVWRFDIDPAITAHPLFGIHFFFCTDQLVSSDGPYQALTGFAANGNQTWAIKFSLNGTQTDITLFDSSDASLGTIGYAVDDGLWHHVWLQDLGGGTGNAWLLTDDQTGTYTSYTGVGILLNIQTTTMILVGGKDTSRTAGKQTKCPKWQFGGLIASSVDTFGQGPLGITGGVKASGSRFVRYGHWAGLSVGGSGTDQQDIQEYTQQGKTFSQASAVLATTIGGVMWCRPTDGVPIMRYPDAVRGITPLMTITIGADDDIAVQPSWKRAVDTIPTRVTATSPSGDVIIINAARETTGVSRTATVETIARTQDAAAYPAQFRLAQSELMRIESITLDLSTAANDLYAAHHSLYPQARIRITGLSTAIFGVSYMDLLVQGWTEVYAEGGVRVTYDTTPADSPGAGVVEDTIYGRVAGTAMTTVASLTSSSTSVAFTMTAGEVFTTTAGDFPMDVLIDSERITLPSAPASSSAPSWTGITRGVAPTIAVAHLAAAAVQIYKAAQVGMG